MSSKYEKSVSMEEEGTYHRREFESVPPKTYTTQSYQVVPVKGSNRHHSKAMKKHQASGDTSDDDNFEEWTTSKRKVNHKTRQVETRVSRQLLVEDGKVIADSGPQVTTRIKEDNKVEECEKEKTPKNKSKFDAIENAPEGESTGRVLGEKKEIQRVSREVREENMQYHDERFKELTGHDVHRRAIQAPHELITITDNKSNHSQAPKGKMVHYTNKGKKYQDTDEILEVAKLAIDGSITKEVKRTKHHEEFSDTEKPDETGEGDELRKKPIVTRSSRRHVDYVNDFDDTSTPSVSSDDEVVEEDSRGAIRKYKSPSSSGRHHQHQHRAHHGKQQHHHQTSKHRNRDDEAFPRYEIDPLLNSLNDDDFKPITSSNNYHHNNSSTRYKEHSLERKDRVDSNSSSGEEDVPEAHYSHRSPSPYSRAPNTGTVEIPEEYRVNKQRLMKSKTTATSPNHPRERSFSPTSKSHLSHASHKSSKSHKSHKEDASVQAHLTDEEEERKSMRSSSSSGANSHEKTTRHLQRQSTANSSRNYYFGENRRRRPSSISSSSTCSDSLVNSKDKLRKNGTRSRDSGFRSPQATSDQQQIYSVSSKSKRKGERGGGGGAEESRRAGAISPTPTTGSVGQRSVKTTTTTMSAGLTDRPGSPIKQERSKRGAKLSSSTRAPSQISREKAGSKANPKSSNTINKTVDKAVEANFYNIRAEPAIVDRSYCDYDDQDRHTFDSVSLSSLGPNATTIKVPYNPEQLVDKKRSKRKHDGMEKSQKGLKQQIKAGQDNLKDMNLREDIEKLRKRLENIDSNTITISRGNNYSRESNGSNKQHFDYKTLVVNVQAAPIIPRQQVVDAYNVRVIEHKSPFNNQQNQPVKSVNELSDSIARLELLSGEASNLDGGGQVNYHMDNNNEANFKLNEFSKYKKPGEFMNNNLENDNISLVSSCSLRSSRTYDVRNTADLDNRNEIINHDELDDEKHFPVEMQNFDLTMINKEQHNKIESVQNRENEKNYENENDKRPAAWVYDLRDGSSTAIVAPPRPKRPESPKIDSKTEDLAESRGGRSYYLELIEPEKKQQQAQEIIKRRPRPSSIDSLYSRWNSHSTLSGSSNNRSNNNQQHNSTPDKSPSVSILNTKDTRKLRQIMPASILDSNSRPIYSTNSINNNSTQQLVTRRQLPFAGPTLSNRSKSSSCLIGPTTRQSKYSIYGGLRKANNDNKPVPRLSYSRAIGPKSQRQIDAQPKTPSRYLKMK